MEDTKWLVHIFTSTGRHIRSEIKENQGWEKPLDVNIEHFFSFLSSSPPPPPTPQPGTVSTTKPNHAYSTVLDTGSDYG